MHTDFMEAGSSMKFFKKVLFSAVIISAFFFCMSVYAGAEVFDAVKIYFSAENVPTIVEGEVVFSLYDESGSTLLDTKTYEIKRNNPGFEIEFKVPRYPIGTKFKFVVEKGAQGAHHNGLYLPEHILETYSMPDENGILQYYTSFYMDLICYWNKEAVINISGTDKTLFYHCLTEDEVYVTLDLLSAMKINYEPHLDEEKPYFILYTDETHRAYFYMDDIYALFGNEGVNLSSPTFQISGMPYVPLSKVAQYFACNYALEEDGRYFRKISLSQSEYSEEHKKNIAVNKSDISSRTNYMIWVSKKDFKVNVYHGSKNNWGIVATFPCSIGAPSTPTVEGQFEYHQYHPIWKYDKYYCGPVMRFYRGYAFHSYLIKYDGTPYDSRLGKRISLGCVRMHPDDIKWMVDNIPLYTKVYVSP